MNFNYPLNIIASDTVSGNVTLRLKDVPWDQALDIILRAKGLDKTVGGRIRGISRAVDVEATNDLWVEDEFLIIHGLNGTGLRLAWHISAGRQVAAIANCLR